MKVKKSEITKVVETVISYNCICPICKLESNVDAEEIEIFEAMCSECFKYFKIVD